MARNNFTVNVVIFGLIISLGWCSLYGSAPNVAMGQVKPAPAPGANKLSITMTLFHIDKSMGTAVAFVTANNNSKGQVLDLNERDASDGKQDGVADAGIIFPTDPLKVGDKFKACVMILNSARIVCDTGYDSPGERTEYISLDLSSKN